MFGKRLVLIVDDDASIGKLVHDMLILEGYEALNADTPEDGLKIAFDKRPSLIILDHNLNSAMDGLDVLAKLRQNNATKMTPVLMLTGSAKTMNNVEKAFDLGVTAYLTKPFEIDRLTKKVASLLEGKS
ncbi:MAG: response regulator transcription factor [Elusimicrobia bacterium]|nr:response regulator transcription factor [Elusimicrobiota bacterium]